MMKIGYLSSLVLVLGCACTTGASDVTKPAHSASGTTSAAAATSAPSSASAPGIPELVSGVRIGAVRIGMTRAELDAVGLPTKPDAVPGYVVAGPYNVLFDGGRVAWISVALRDMPSGARVGGAVFDKSA